jgi:YbbR domain-containing protein
MNKRYHTLAGSFLVAALFWFSVTMSGSFRSRFDIPLVVTNMSEDIALVKPLPETIEVLLQARGWQLLFLTAGKQLAYEIQGNRLRSGIIQTNRALAESMILPEGVVAIRAYPETLFVQLDRFIKKKIPLDYSMIKVSFKEGFGIMRNIEITPDSVIVQGAVRVVKDIDSWPIEMRNYSELSDVIEEQVPLLDSLRRVVKFNTKKVVLSIPTEQLADMSFLGIRVSLLNVPGNREVLLGQQSIDVYVRGGVNFLATLVEEDFVAEIKFEDIVADTSGTIIPTLHFPAGLHLLKTVPYEIRYTIRK